MMCPDIYFEPDYGKLYETEGCEAVQYKFECEDGIVTNQFLKRKINISLSNGEEYYDIVTPYGYGGPIIRALTGSKKKLLNSFAEAMAQYAAENNIVSEFVRFHPILDNGVDFKEIYSSTWNRKTVGTNVREYTLEEEFSKSARKTIKRAEKAGVTYEVIQNPSDISDFQKVYYSTMDRDSADDYYYFGEAYFNQCLAAFGEHVLYVKVYFEKQLIAAGLYFVYGDILQCHLSGTLSEYLSLSPAYIIKYATARWAAEHGIHFVHYGGGTSPDETNSLYQFKKKFGQKTEFDFYVGKKIWNQTIYDTLCNAVGVEKESSFFPAYRKTR